MTPTRTEPDPCILGRPLHRPRLASRLGAASLMLMAFLPTAGCGGPDEDRLLASLQQRLERQDLDGAVIEAKNLVQVAPESARARFWLGRVLLDSGDVAGADTELGRAERLGHAPAELVPVLARLMNAQGRTREVITRFGATSLEDAGAAALLAVELSRAHRAQGDAERAGAVIAAALQRAPEHLPARVQRARLAVARGDVDSVREAVQALLSRHGGDSAVHLLHGEWLAAGGDHAAAVAAHRRAVELRPYWSDAHAALVQALLRAGELSPAAEAAAAMRKQLPADGSAVYLQALVAFLQNDLPAARGHLQLLSRKDAEDGALLLLAGSIEARLGALVQAESLLTNAAARLPASTRPRLELAAVYLRQDRPGRALDALARLFRDDTADAEAWRLAGQAHVRLGDFARADEAFARARSISPRDPAVLVDTALSRLARGDLDAGMGQLQSAAQADPQGIAAELALVAAHLRQRRVAPALAVVDAIERKQPRSALADYLRGRIHLRSGDTSKARASFERALLKEPTNHQVVQNLAALDRADGRSDLARARFDALLKADPRATPAMLALAGLALQDGAPYAQVTAWLDRAVQVDPADSRAWRAAVALQRSAGDTVGALTRARAAVAAVPNDIDVQATLADVLLAEGDVQQAINALNRAVELQPDAVGAHLRLAGAHVAAGNLARAAQHAERALRLTPDAAPAARVAIGLALLQERPARALDIARAVQARRPALGWQLVGEVHAHREDWDESAAAFRRALAQEPATEPALQLLVALQRGGRKAEAAAHVRSWLESHPDDATFLGQLGEQALLAGDAAQAVVHYRRAVALRGDDALLLNNLAMALLQRKDPEALAVAMRAQRFAPGAASVLDTLAQAHAASRQWPKAIEWQSRAVALEPRNGELRMRLARWYLDAGNKPKAREELQRVERLGDPWAQSPELRALQQRAS